MDILADAGIIMDYPCGGRGVCGKCAIKILDDSRGKVSGPTEAEKRVGSRLACQTAVSGEVEISIAERKETVSGDGIRSANLKNICSDNEKDSYAERNFEVNSAAVDIKSASEITAAADIGTTTVAMRLYDNDTGRIVWNGVRDNPQQQYGADVLSRLYAAESGKSERLRDIISGCLLEMADGSGYGENISEWIITGNTSMLTLLTGEDPAPLTRAPYRAERLFDETISFGGKKAYLPPCLQAFVGADALCSLLASGIAENDGPRLICDIGTNGEMILWNGKSGYAASVSAGPALEGVGIREGCRAVPGAIDRVALTGAGIQAHTINGIAAVGICGSGIVDAAACGLNLGLIDKYGNLEEPFFLRDGISVYPEDIRQIQLVKAAIRAGIDCLIQEAGIQTSDLKDLILCGGFGNRLNPVSAARVGFFSAEALSSARCLGNLALEGAGMLRNKEGRERLRNIRDKLHLIELGGDRDFQSAFIASMNFD